MHKHFTDNEGCLPAISILAVIYSIIAGTAFILYSIFYS